MPDRGLWITWYDLPPGRRDEYLRWLHEIHLPDLLRRPGMLWAAHYSTVEKIGRPRQAAEGDTRHADPAAVPAGNGYVLIVGAADAAAFCHPAPAQWRAGLDGEAQEMLAMRLGERVNIMTEVTRIGGPEAGSREQGTAPASCIQLGSFNCAWQDEDDVLAWYAQSRMPAVARLPGCASVRLLASVSGWAKHAILYEFVTLEARNRHYPTHEDGHPEMKAWTERVTPKLTHAPGNSNVAVRIWPA